MSESLARYILHSDSEGSSTPLVFLHGFMGTGSEFETIAGRMDRTCIGIDLPGHGRSAGVSADAFTTAGVVEALRSMISDLVLDGEMGGKPFTLIGYSMGARIALAFALAYPERVDRLVLESVSPGISDEAERQSRLVTDRARAAEIRDDFGRFVSAWYSQPLFDSLKQRPALFDSVCQSRMLRDPIQMALVIEGMSPGSTPDYWDQIGDLHMPVGVLAGSLDSKYVRISADMSRRNPRIERIIIEGAGHNTHLEQPLAYLAALESLLISDTEPE